jgi:hypothetical protein
MLRPKGEGASRVFWRDGPPPTATEGQSVGLLDNEESMEIVTRKASGWHKKSPGEPGRYCGGVIKGVLIPPFLSSLSF